ncbi:MAG TPA: hypothetical protein VMF58_18530 [Rhizomicrobium sp.]|nr:hypothetical protein [Rhizomicrobium sp.]
MPKIIRRDLLKAAAAQSALLAVMPSWANAKSRVTTYYPTVLGAGGHSGAAQSYLSNTFCNVGLGRSAMENPPITDETRAQQIIRVPGTISNLSWGLEYHSGSDEFAALTFSLNRNANPTSLAVSFNGGTSGWNTDSTHSVSVTAGKLLSFEADVGDGVSNFTGAFYCASAQFVSSDTSDPPIQSAQMLATVGPTDVKPTTTQKYGCFLGILGNSSLDATANESFEQFKCLTGGLWRNMACNVDSNDFNHNTIVANRINAANGSMSFSISANTSGYFEDLSDDDSVSAGDLLDYGFIQGNLSSPTGSDNLTVDWVGAHFLASSPDECMIGGTPTDPGATTSIQAGNTGYSSLLGGGNQAYPNTVRATGKLPYRALASQYSNHILSWAGPPGHPGSVTFNLRDQNGTAVLSTTATDSMTGWITASGTYQFSAGDTCMNEIVVAGTITTYQGLNWSGAGLLLQAD